MVVVLNHPPLTARGDEALPESVRRTHGAAKIAVNRLVHHDECSPRSKNPGSFLHRATYVPEIVQRRVADCNIGGGVPKRPMREGRNGSFESKGRSVIHSCGAKADGVVAGNVRCIAHETRTR